MKQNLEIGTKQSGAKFTVPLDLVTHTLAAIGIRGSGKTVAATVIAEEMCEAGLPWVAIDPVGVWWGLRCNPDGSPGGYPVVVLGGEHADLPIEKNMGAKVADAILEQNVSCVIDMSNESKNAVRWFVAEFCDRLMELRPDIPRHIFLEEAPELVPQRPMGEQKRSLAAVDRLIRLGRNRGYGATLISQRVATIQKDVLTQCESLLALRVVGKHDRDAFASWIAEVVQEADSERKADKFMDSLTELENGQGWFWSPQWLRSFDQIRIRRRKTFHPGETRTIGQAPKQVQLSDVKEFVSRFEQVLQKPQLPKASKIELHRPVHVDFQQESTQLRAQIADLHRQLGQANGIIANLRKHLEPEYRAMQALFGELQNAPSNGHHVDAGVFEPWKEKLGKGPARLIDILLERGEVTRVQLKTLAGYSGRSMTNHISSLNSNQLIEKDGDKIRLRVP